jgi:phospholipid/cholesterol/gamma-HCH transport system permease protein
MPMATVSQDPASAGRTFTDLVYDAVSALGDFALFAGRTFAWLLTRRPAARTLLPSFYTIGVRSVPVVAVTGMFIGMVMAVQFYNQLSRIGLGTRMGSLINISLVRELGPVLAATMLAGRVGSAMAAELGTMRVTEQVDALAVLGADPLHYLVVPRLIACVVLIPLLTILADFMGIMGGAFICTRIYGIEAHYYWEHSQGYVTLYDVLSGLVKALFFGAAIALISCHRGLNSRPGAEGVGRASTEAFVTSFVVILILDFFLGKFLLDVYYQLWPGPGPSLFSA